MQEDLSFEGRPGQSLGTRVIVSALIAAGLLVFAFSGVGLFALTGILEAHIQKKARLAVDLQSDALSLPVADFDTRQAEILVQRLLERPEFIAARVIEGSGDEMLSLNPAVFETPADDSRLFRAAIKIDEGGETVDLGTLELIVDFSSVSRARFQATIYSLIAAGLMMSGIFVVLYLNLRRVIGPLNHMSASMQHLASGVTDLKISFLDRKDEIGLVARSVEVFRENAIALRSEVKRRQAAEERVKFEAYHDSVTLLPNRSKFIDVLSEIIESSSESGYRGCAVFSVLLDRVKMINHSLGVRSGDKLVKEAALRLRDSIGKKGYLARLDTETFAVLMEGMCDQKAAESIALVMKKAMERPFVIDGQEVYITLSVGVAFSTDRIERADEILQSSGLALATARSKGFNSLVFYEDSHRSDAQDRLKLENDLRRAIRDGTQLQMFFQPVMTLSGNRVAGFESLMRWNHPDRILISPGVFIPIAEESDLVVPMGSWALRHSAGQLAEWHKGCGPDLFISVNVSGRQLYADDLVQVVKDVLSDSGIPPKSLKLEITETVLMDEPDVAIKVLNEVRDLGVRLGIDDFGTGYSSLSYLQQLPADVLKIDRAFIQNMADSAEDQQIVKTIADLGHNLGMTLIAEGIERENEVPLLRQYGCDLTQGFFFARPMPAGEAGAFLRKTNMT